MRESQPIFWLNPKNKNFNDERKIYDQRARKYLNLTIIYGTLTVLYTLITQIASKILHNYQRQSFDATAIIIVLGITAYLLAAYAIRKSGAKQLEKDGIILTGKIVEGTITIQRRSTVKVTITYRFKTPNGEIIEGEDSDDNPSVLSYGTPSKGRPVRIVYLDDEHYRML